IGRFDQGKPKSAEPDLLHLITGWPVRINPILYATEGKDRRFPTQEELRTRLEWATAKLKVALPDAVLVVGPEAIAPAIATLEATRNRFEREQDFLVRIAPLLSSGVNEQNRRTKWHEVLAAVRDCHLSMRSLVVTLALSSVMVPNGGPAKLLKFRAKYTEAHA